MLKKNFIFLILDIDWLRPAWLIGLLWALTVSAWAADSVYVSLDGSHVEPYDTWATAATNIQTAVDYACANIGSYDTVLVSNGTFYAPTEAGILVAAPLTIKSQQGREQTLVHGQGLTEAIFTISNAQAVVDGFTITNGSRRGVLMYGGTLQNCAIVSNSFSGGSSQGAGVYMTNGLVTNCFIAWNRRADQGGGAYLRGDARLVDSVIVSNYPQFDGGGVYVQGAGVIISGCRITHNRARQGGTMGGVLISTA